MPSPTAVREAPKVPAPFRSHPSRRETVERRKNRLADLTTVLFLGALLALAAGHQAPGAALLVASLVSGAGSARLRSSVERWDDESRQENDQAFRF